MPHKNGCLETGNISKHAFGPMQNGLDKKNKDITIYYNEAHVSFAMYAVSTQNLANIIPCRTIPQCQRSQSRTQDMIQYSYAYFLPVDTFPKSTILRHQHSVYCRTAIVRYVFWKLEPK